MSNPLSKTSPTSPHRGSDSNQDASPQQDSWDPSIATARLSSPLPTARQDPSQHTPSGDDTEGALKSPKSGTESPHNESLDRAPAGPRPSALANALSASLERSATRNNSVPTGHITPSAENDRTQSQNNYGSIGPSSAQVLSGNSTPRPHEDFDVVRRHLAGPSTGSPTLGSVGQGSQNISGQDDKDNNVADQFDQDGDDFSSLRLQGGDMTREIYRRAEAEVSGDLGAQRRNSINVPRIDREDDEFSVKDMTQPQGFRRQYLRQHAASPVRKDLHNGAALTPTPEVQPSMLTRNFYEFLTLYGHFAGDEWDEDDHDSDDRTGDDEDDESSPLLKKITRRATRKEQAPKKGIGATVLILLKSFVGTGVLFLPRAFFNGGMLFSCVVLLIASFLSYYCFVLLTKSRLKLKGSYAEMGEIVQGKFLRAMINGSLVLSQVGFAASYIVFVGENLQAFVLAVTKGKTYIEMKFMILMQLVIFLPLSLYRNLNSIAVAVYIADVFIVAGLVYLYYYDFATIAANNGVHDIVAFNPKTWPLFVGTAVFTFEGIGLIIPIQDGMRNPERLPSALSGVMVIITMIFISVGSFSYAAYGSKTQTVIILNMDPHDKFVNAVQFIYSLAIVLSTPLQIFPAITILEKAAFTRSGKTSLRIKWAKNVFRFVIIICTALIAWLGAGDLDKFVSLVGSFACVPLVYWYPAFIHMKGVATARWQVYVDIGLMVLGLAIMVYTSTLTIMSWVSNPLPVNPS